jgi:TPP-dependent indolepyruvate ferredoxin oxidoreductase alpha subunit
MTWPLEADGVHEFAKGLDEILVVEEKRQILEYALKEELYNLPDGQRRAWSANSTTPASGATRARPATATGCCRRPMN